jgi:hypothetical protein
MSDDEFTDEERRWHRIVDRCAMELKAAGADPAAVPHILLTAALYRMAESHCSVHLADELKFARDWIDERLAETRQEIGDT